MYTFSSRVRSTTKFCTTLLSGCGSNRPPLAPTSSSTASLFGGGFAEMSYERPPSWNSARPSASLVRVTSLWLMLRDVNLTSTPAIGRALMRGSFQQRSATITLTLLT